MGTALVPNDDQWVFHEDPPTFRHSLVRQRIDEAKEFEPSELIDSDIPTRANEGGNSRRFGSSTFTRLSFLSLYSRSDEESKLIHKFRGLVCEPSTELLLISGASGSGKTRLATTLKGPVTDLGGYFLTAKFDQLQRPSPYAALVSAFTEFSSLVVERGDSVVLRMRDAINNGVGEDVANIRDMIPSLEAILGKGDSDEVYCSVDGATQRFANVFRDFLRAVSSQECPIVLLLDDVHWADHGSLDVVFSILKDSKNEGLVVVGTCPDHMPISSYLPSKLRDLEANGGVQITRIEVRNLGAAAVTSLIADVLQLDVGAIDKLGDIALHQTEGNPANVISFLRWLHESDLLCMDHSSGTWRWNADEIEMTIDTRHVGDYLVDELEQLPKTVQDVLKVSACLGAHLDARLIECVLGVPVTGPLEEAASRGVITRDGSGGYFRFDHDRVQVAAYGLIPEDQRELFHLEIGRRLWSQLNADELDQHLFTLVSQMNFGKRLITLDEDRNAVATLCCHAGTKAARSSDFRTALFYLELGISLLGNRSWRDNYDLALSLHSAAAEMAMCSVDLEKMNELVDQVIHHARSLTDKTGAYATRIFGVGRVHQQEAINLGLEVLRELGETFPSRLNKFHLILELFTVEMLLRGKSNEQLLRIPTISNKEKLACLKILHIALAATITFRPQLFPFLALRMMKLTLKYGLSALASIAFGGYAMCSTGAGAIDAGSRFGELSLVLLERFQSKEYLPRVYGAYYGCVSPWKKPLRNSIAPLLLGYKTGIRTGDIGAACMCAAFHTMYSLSCNVPLDVMIGRLQTYQQHIDEHQLKSLSLIIAPAIVSIHKFVGSPEKDFLELERVAQRAEECQQVVASAGAKVETLMIAYVFSEYDIAESMRFERVDIWKVPPGYIRIRFLFYTGALALDLARLGRKVWRNMRTANKAFRLLRRYSTLSPHNVLHLVFLLQAERASVRRQNDRAYEKYTAALAMAEHSDYWFMIALVNERTARHFLFNRNLGAARPYFEGACRYYEKWRALAKLRSLEAEMLSLYS